ncbi:hypothetical protein C7N43_19835 [Sphingobacteriales bacterium UPWRP_1]|nr:hypothetical protein BVG80_02555 [Sphingobacteriales bacterium TSM_CSM]PSJ75238.1 hypothetical protein C7N43_19835 [Sphingobacteriales bacterium UPWRP_1]
MCYKSGVIFKCRERNNRIGKKLVNSVFTPAAAKALNIFLNYFFLKKLTFAISFLFYLRLLLKAHYFLTIKKTIPCLTKIFR